MRRRLAWAAAVASSLWLGCVSTVPPPLPYVALERPTGPIRGSHSPVYATFPRGGFYFMNRGLRPAPDVGAYLERAHDSAGTAVLTNADVEIRVPANFGILFFGYNRCTDGVWATGILPPEAPAE